MPPVDVRRRRLAVTIGATAVVLVAVVIVGSRRLDAAQQGWLLLGCTLVSVAAASSLFWLTEHEIGWVTLAAVLLAVTPLAVGRAADEIVLSASGHLDSCVVTGVAVEPGLADAFRTVRYRHQLDCVGSGRQELSIAASSVRNGEHLSVWIDGSSRRGAVAADGTGAPSVSRDLLLALLVLLGLVVSGGAAVRQAARPGPVPPSVRLATP